MSTYRKTASSVTRTSNLSTTTSDGLAAALRYGASEILAVAEKTDVAMTTAGYILVFHATELALKAFLAKCGVPELDLEIKYRHDLIKLFNDALSYGLIVSSPHAKEIIAWIDEYQQKAFIRYKFAEYRSLSIPEDIHPLILEVLKATK
jgi:hypothetical protein